MARAAADRFGLEEVLFAPTGRQPLKENAAGAAFADRLAMVELVCEEDARFQACALDGPRADGKANYTVDALEAVRAEMPGVELFGIVGMDAFLQMPRWREPERLRSLAEWIVVTRPGYVRAGLVEGGINLLEGLAMDVAATRLRERLRMGEHPVEWISGPVLAYITEHGLYRPEPLISSG